MNSSPAQGLIPLTNGCTSSRFLPNPVFKSYEQSEHNSYFKVATMNLYEKCVFSHRLTLLEHGQMLSGHSTKAMLAMDIG
ncbi:hypothetical protein J31TS3_15270 [Paenibacillus lactis]|nr:hypothetical protein J31TS3_15270 [Paenibacillus lactis]